MTADVFLGSWYKESHVVPVQTDKTGRLLLETPADLENLLLLRKTKKEQKAAVKRPTMPPAVHLVVTHSHRKHTHTHTHH